MRVLKLVLPVLAGVGGILSTLLMYLGSFGTVDTVFKLVLSLAILLFFTALFILLCLKKLPVEKKFRKLNRATLIWGFFFLIGVKLLFDRGMFAIFNLAGIHYELKLLQGDLNVFETINDCASGLLCGPIVEEFLFRKIMLSAYKSRLGKLYGMLGAAVVFGLLHSGITKWVCILTGIILALVYLHTENIWYTVLIHIFINAFNLGAALLALHIGDTKVLSSAGSLVYCSNEILMAGVLISCIALSLKLWSRRGDTESIYRVSKEEISNITRNYAK